MRQVIAPLFLAACFAFAQLPVPTGSPKLTYATYAGAAQYSAYSGVAVDPSGFAYVSGSGPVSDSTCTFLTKLNQAGTDAVWSICTPFTEVDGIALDVSGSIYVIGTNSHLIGNALSRDPSTVIKFTADGQTTVYSVQISGAYATAISVDTSGAVYLAGQADMSTFQTIPGANSSNPASSTFAEKLNPDGTVAYATGIDLLSVGGITVDSIGQAWVAGAACFPIQGVVNLICDTTRLGTASAIRKLDAQGVNVLVAVTFGGGGRGVDAGVNDDRATGVKVDPFDAVWFVGADGSGRVPVTPGALVSQGGPYAIKLSPSGDVQYGTYLGSVVSAYTTPLAIDLAGNPYFVLNTSNLASVLLHLNVDGSPVLSSQNLSVTSQGIAIDGNGGLYTATSIAPPGIPGNPNSFCPTTPGAYQPLNGVYQPFAAGPGICVAKFDLTQNATAQVGNPVNAASLLPSAVAPGELISIPGVNLPSNPVVSFDGIRAPILYSDANRITTVIPFNVRSTMTALEIVGVGGRNLYVWPASPGLFTADGSGSGQLHARNADGTLNSSANPAVAGSTVTLYMTGAGAMTPNVADGTPGPVAPPFPTPYLNVTATVNNISATVLGAFQAPGRVAGVLQVDVAIPVGTSSGDALVAVAVGNAPYENFPTIARTTIAVQKPSE